MDGEDEGKASDKDTGAGPLLVAKAQSCKLSGARPQSPVNAQNRVTEVSPAPLTGTSICISVVNQPLVKGCVNDPILGFE